MFYSESTYRFVSVVIRVISVQILHLPMFHEKGCPKIPILQFLSLLNNIQNNVLVVWGIPKQLNALLFKVWIFFKSRTIQCLLWWVLHSQATTRVTHFFLILNYSPCLPFSSKPHQVFHCWGGVCHSSSQLAGFYR